MPANGQVSISGDAAAVSLLRSGRSYRAGSLPEGRYEIMVTFTEGGESISGGTVMVQADERVVVDCSAAFMRCRVR